MFLASITLAALLQVAPATWTVSDSVSAVDGQRSYLAGVESQADLLNSIGRPTKALLSVGCVNDRRLVMLAWPTFLGRDETGVTWRGAVGAPVRFRFEVLTGGTTAVSSGRDAERLLAAIEGGGVLAVRVEGYAETQEATFSLADAAPLIATVREACPRRS